MWDLETKSHKKLPLEEHVALLAGYPAYPRRCHSVSFTTDGSRFATSVNDVFLAPSILVWDAKASRVSNVIATAHRAECFGYAPDGSTVTAGYYDPDFDIHPLRQQVVAVWDAASGKMLVAGPAFELGARAFAYTRDGKYLLIVGQREGPPFPFGDKPGGPPVIGVWEVATGKIVSEISPLGLYFPRIAISPDNKLLAVPAGTNIDIYAIEYTEQPKPKAN